MKLSDFHFPNLRQNIPLGRYTSSRIGGPAEALVVVESADELVRLVTQLWKEDLPFMILGGGSNVLVSDAGVRGVVVVNRNQPGTGFRFDETSEPPTVCTEAGVSLNALAQQAAALGLGSLEWASGIPGTVGGAVVGNAGAHGADMAVNLLVAEILHRVEGSGAVSRREEWSVERFNYQYRSSVLKSGARSGLLHHTPQDIVLTALLRLERSTPAEVQAKTEAITERRRRAIPPGASMGSIFKNPPGDGASLTAGRLIEAAGLKGTCIGEAEISSQHANFFINRGEAKAADVWALIQLARSTVEEKFGVKLELEVELVGEW
jgi:UDP-N-acetylmuramate dehydrogenase